MKKGFTLLELLIVIGILAVLSAVTILVINPAEILKKSRDSQRISDLNNLKTAIGYYLVNAATVSMGVSTTNYSTANAAGVQCYAATGKTVSVTTTLVVTGAGWLPIDFSGLTGGSPIGSLPLDPANTAYNATHGYYYAYTPDDSVYQYETTTNMESAYYRNGGTGDVESKDGGNAALLYGVGTKLSIGPATPSSTCFGDGNN